MLSSTSGGVSRDPKGVDVRVGVFGGLSLYWSHKTLCTAGPGFESRRNDVGVPLPVLGGAWIHAAQGRHSGP